MRVWGIDERVCVFIFLFLNHVNVLLIQKLKGFLKKERNYLCHLRAGEIAEDMLNSSYIMTVRSYNMWKFIWIIEPFVSFRFMVKV